MGARLFAACAVTTFLACLTIAIADEVRLKDGTVYRGKVVMETRDAVGFKTADGKIVKILRRDIATIRPGEEPAPNPSAPTTAPAAGPAPVSDASPSSAAKTAVNPIDGAEMIFIPSGEYLSGESEEQFQKRDPGGYINWQRAKEMFPGPSGLAKVNVPGYWIYKYEVTVGQYRKFCQATGRDMPEAPVYGLEHAVDMSGVRRIEGKWQDNLPMSRLSFNDALAYAEWAGATIPNSRQWEKAARGSDGRSFPWGEQEQVFKLLHHGSRGPHAPGSVKADVSPFGVMDMGGNVREFTVLAGEGDRKCGFMGGFWDGTQYGDFACYRRYGPYPRSHLDKTVGFRCATPEGVVDPPTARDVPVLTAVPPPKGEGLKETKPTFTTFGCQTTAIAFLRDGKTFLTATTDDRITQYTVAFDARSIRGIDATKDGGSHRIWLSPDCRCVVAGRPPPKKKTQMIIANPKPPAVEGPRAWDLTTGKVRFPVDTTSPVCCAFSADGARMACAGQNGCIAIHDVRTGQRLARIETAEHLPVALCFSGDGAKLMSAGQDGTLRTWNLDGRPANPPTTVVALPSELVPNKPLTPYEQAMLRGKQKARLPQSAAFSPDGQWLVAATGDGTVVLFDTTAGQVRARQFADVSGEIKAIFFSADGRRVVFVGPKVTLNDFATGGLAGKTPDGQYLCAALSPDGKLLITSSSQRGIQSWTVPVGEGK